MIPKTLRIATRTSHLALWQSEYIAGRLRETVGKPTVELVHVQTAGDGNQTTPLRDFGGVGVFTKEVQRAVLDGRADIAVHSLKDLPTESDDELTLAAVPDRAARTDVLVLPTTTSIDALDDLPESASIGTGSPRRQAQLLYHRSDLRSEIRGNVETRLQKLDAGEFDAIVLAEAGLCRLGLANRISVMLPPPLMYPAIGQGALGIECRSNDSATQAILEELNDPETLASTLAERSLLQTLRAGCHAPLGAWSQINSDELSLTGVLLSPDGTTRLEAHSAGSVNDAETVGVAVAEDLLAAGGDQIIGGAVA